MGTLTKKQTSYNWNPFQQPIIERNYGTGSNVKNKKSDIYIEKREPQFIISSGMKMSGKTQETCKIIEEYLTSNSKTGKKSRRVLIFDINHEYENSQLKKDGFNFKVKTIALKDLEKWVKNGDIEAVRILPVDEKGNAIGVDKIADILNIILHYYRGGLLVLENTNYYLMNRKRVDTTAALCVTRHLDLDIIMHLQSLSPVTQTMWQNLTSIRFHYQMDSVERIKARINNYELFSIVQSLVKNKYDNGNKYFHCWVLLETYKIRGEFSEQDLFNACFDYVEANPRKFSKGVIRDEDVRELFNKYNGNPVSEDVDKAPSFKRELEQLINRFSREQESNTPDYVLAEYLKNCLDAYNYAVKGRDEHLGIKPSAHYSKGTIDLSKN